MTTSASRRRRSVSAGFTLIEVLISILIFSLGVLGTIALQARVAQFTAQNGDRGRAAVLANELVSNMWANQSQTPDPNYLSQIWAPQLNSSAGLPNANYQINQTASGTSINIYWKGPTVAASAASASYSTTVVIQ